MKIMNKRLMTFVTGFLILIQSSCAAANNELPETDPGPGSAAGNNLVGTRWRLMSYGQPGSENAVLDGTEITLEFVEGNQTGGSGGCNTFGAHYQISGGEISFSEVISTLLACPNEDATEQEQAYFEALRTANEFDLSDGQLRIWYDNRQSVLNFERL